MRSPTPTVHIAAIPMKPQSKSPGSSMLDRATSELTQGVVDFSVEGSLQGPRSSCVCLFALPFQLLMAARSQFALRR